VSLVPLRHEPKSDLTMSTDGLTISVVIAVRDGERTIQTAVQSALDQTSPPTEVIVVDDMSRDGTRRRVLDLMSDRVRVIAGEGRGVSAARNVGIGAARGTWIAFLDGDDYWRPEFLELARRRIGSSSEAVACFGAALPVDDEGRLIGRHAVPDVVTLEELVRGQVVPTTSAALLRREAAIACGGFFDGIRRAAEDLDLWFRIAAVGDCIGVPQAAAVYVVHDERDRSRSVEVLAQMERDRELVIDRLAARGVAPSLVRTGRAIMRARTARYWLRAEMPTSARSAARASLRARPTLEGCVTLTMASVPSAVRQAMLRWRRRHLAARLARGT
jgi:glycosyltransferase involved in cell wall biosynthesis